jgi:Holliday junction resolvase RusA-like endonuclease
MSMKGGDGNGGNGRSAVSVVPFLPPSVNSLYNVIYNQRRVEKKPEVREFCYRAKGYLKSFPLTDGAMVRMDLIFAYPFNHKNAKLRRKDSQNMIKILADLVAEKGGWDDCRMKSGSWESVDSEVESVTVTLIEVVGE